MHRKSVRFEGSIQKRRHGFLQGTFNWEKIRLCGRMIRKYIEDRCDWKSSMCAEKENDSKVKVTGILPKLNKKGDYYLTGE